MLNSILGFNWVGIILVILTLLFIAGDKAFSKKVRVQIRCALVLSLVSIFINNYMAVVDGPAVGISEVVVRTTEVICWLLIATLLVCVFQNVKSNKSDYVFAGVMAGLFVVAFIVDLIIPSIKCAGGLCCLIVASFYFYFVMQAYKKDGLTKLLMRNNLIYEMEDMVKKQYNLVFIDVDNFKLINDKYGHDKGDEVLGDIVNAVSSKLPNGCKFYRYGGDEFVIISRKADIETLTNAMDEANNELANKELRISCGIVTHMPGEEINVSLIEADKKMYENKKLLKSEDIWDDMTGLYNYRGFIDELDIFRKAVVKEGNKVCLVSVDIDRLGNINMAYGYTEGNLAIKTLSRIIKSCLSGRDFIGHLGSDEFEVAIECTSENDEKIMTFIDGVREGIGSAYEFASKDYSLKVNVGKYLIADDEIIGSEQIVNNVLYAKQADKEDRRKADGTYDIQEENREEAALVKNILDNNLFKYAFQPIVSAKDGEIIAYESLMRSDTETMLSPLKILKYAEKSNRLYDVEKRTFFNVLEQVKKTKCIPEGRRIFINSIPGYMLEDEDYNLLREKYHDLFKDVVMEITEHREVEEEALATINRRRDEDGFNLAIDDYGSGYSNTNSLLRYMPQVVKIDRLLITGIDRNSKKQFFVNSIISFARENDMKILAEGVETESELKTVIRLGVDMIQGYFTAKPSFEILDEIPKNIKKIIVDENMKVSGNQRMVYTASSNCELSVFNLAMEDYSKINISAENVSIIGNPEYTADLVIKVKDGVNSKITLTDVLLNSIDDEPCIEIGENSNVTIALEGENRLNAKGIHVPDGSSLTIKGGGNLLIYASGHEAYAIGSDSESGFGKLNFKNSGDIIINIDGEICTGIGGGVATENSAINIISGGYQVNVAGVQAVGIGCHKGKFPISIKDARIKSDFRVNIGVVVGTLEGELDVNIGNFDLDINGSGSTVAGVGSINESSGKISLSSGAYKIDLKGQKIFLLGCPSGTVEIEMEHIRIAFIGEGDNVLGIGSLDMKSLLTFKESSVDLVINASSPLGLGIDDNCTINRIKIMNAKINGEEIQFPESAVLV